MNPTKALLFCHYPYAMMLWTDSVERERSGLMRRRLVRLLAPQTSEAPQFMHLTDVSPAGIKKAVDLNGL